VLAHSGLSRACDKLIDRARAHFAEADAIMARTPRRATRAPRLMGAVYKIILADLVTRGFAPPRKRVRVSKPRLLWLLASNAIV